MRFINPIAKQSDEECLRTLRELRSWVRELSSVDKRLSYITRYAVITTSGALERSFKTIIADYVTHGEPAYIDEYITRTLRRSSMNPSVEAIVKTLVQFDSGWKDSFNRAINSLPHGARDKDALTSLVEIRNKIAHGAPVIVSFNDVVQYYVHARNVVAQLEVVLR